MRRADRPEYYPIPSEGLKRRIRERDNYICQLCGKYPAREVDHIVPLAISHDNSPENLRVLCHRCNHITGNIFGKIGGSPNDDSLLNRWSQEIKAELSIYYKGLQLPML